MKINHYQQPLKNRARLQKIGKTVYFTLLIGYMLWVLLHIPVQSAIKSVEAKPEVPVVIKEVSPAPKTVDELLTEYFPANQINNAKLVIKCESGGRPNAINKNRNGSTDTGLFQLNSIHHYAGDLTDPETNIKYASQLYQGHGWQPWYSSKKCHHLS